MTVCEAFVLIVHICVPARLNENLEQNIAPPRENLTWTKHFCTEATDVLNLQTLERSCRLCGSQHVSVS